MRWFWSLVVCGFGLAGATNSAQAGLYSTLEPPPALSSVYFRKFQEDTLTPLKQLATPAAVKSWQKYYELAATAMLVAKEPPPLGALTVEDRMNLAICLLRVREPGKQMPEKAIRILRDANKLDKDNFLVLSTLGTANQITGNYRDADAYLGEGLRYWLKSLKDGEKNAWKSVNVREEWQAICANSLKELNAQRQKVNKPPVGMSDKDFAENAKIKSKKSSDNKGWSEKEFAWHAKCELYQRHLVRLRMKEGGKGGPMTFDKAMEGLDPLFDPYPLPKDKQPLHFVGDSGKFEPGKMANTEKAKLPPDAIEIVEQLLVWTPDDLRLFWLLGELFNARGDVDSAKIVLTEFLGKFAQSEAAREGLQQLDPETGQPVIDIKQYLPKFIKKHPHVGNRLQALLDYVPPPLPIAEKAGKGNADPNPPAPEPKKDETAPAPLKLDWQTLGVGLGAGVVVGFLVSWRLRDVLRRRKGPGFAIAQQPVAGWVQPPKPGSTGIQTDPH